MIKETKNKGVFFLSFLGLFFLGLGIWMGVDIFQNNGVDNLVSQKKILTDSPVSASDKLAVQLVYVDPEALAETEVGSNIYFVIYTYGQDQYGFIGLEASPDDKEVNALIKKADKLEEKPEWLEVKPILVNDDEAIEGYSDYMKEVFAEDEELSNSFQTFRYISRVGVGASGDLAWEYGKVLFIAGLGIIILGSAFFTRKRNVAAYKGLYEAYPEVEGNLGLLVQEADYHHEKIGLLIYKHHIFTYKQGVDLADIREISQIYHSVINRKRYFITVSRTSTLDIIRKEGKNLSLPIKNIGKNTDQELTDFFTYLAEKYPDILLGYHA